MARMIPPKFDHQQTKSSGEKLLFERLQRDPDTKNWIVLHQYDVANHKGAISGEIDFLILVPGKGVLALEVKAHQQVSRDEQGRWFLGRQSTGNDKSPFVQVSVSMHCLREYICNKDTRLRSIPFISAVIFTHCNFDATSPEWRPSQLMNAEQLKKRGIGQLILNTFDKERERITNLPTGKWFTDPKAPSNKSIEQLLFLLRPPLSFSLSPQNRLDNSQQEVLEYTQEQFLALEAINYNDRILYTGPAGTGKTVLAIEAAKRAVLEHKKILFICFNRYLVNYIKDNLSQADTNEIDIINIHALMTRITNRAPVEDTPEFWNSVLPESTLDCLLDEKSELTGQYDLLIVDETQDIVAHPKWLDILDLLLKGGLHAGKWLMFGDFKGQAIFSNIKEKILFSNLNERASHFPVYPLSVNCRNTLPVVEQNKLIGRLGDLYSLVRRGEDEEHKPVLHYFKNQEEQSEKVLSSIDKLLADGYPHGSITLLSPLNRSPVIELISQKRTELLTPYYQPEASKIAYTTIHSFKGLENAFIIITDIDEIESIQMRKLLYTAMSRTTLTFYLFLSNKTVSQLQKLVTEAK
ncbi:nuclease-related domain-containing DEAD/DEAH box helicase [Zophobihabitans entericus]|uniref:DEAD/DEAH box helicase family protein n=1 Tax=Zophobihabitans entericus TaxID=1635327 RepID=A0A6G9I9U6_9GAMM|nr:NERD domain-containing protein/DEAD/DEAH box helicase [Zophobihabitans entericus]QIQ21008.1 DEAD/DEAH box helicase family protein [Zophobihabitans entericus]